jgi:hypothetical protein
MDKFQTSILDFTLDDEGILHCSCRDMPVSYDHMVETVDMVRKRIGERQVCMLIDATYTRLMDKKTSRYAAREFAGPGKAVAIYSRSTFGALTANIFFHFYPQKFPLRFFTDKGKAIQWLKAFTVTG